MLYSKEKQKIIEKHRVHEKDTGSSAVQVGLLGEQIERLSSHLKKNRKDSHSRRGLLKMVAKRKSLLTYLAQGDPEKLTGLLRKYGIKK